MQSEEYTYKELEAKIKQLEECQSKLSKFEHELSLTQKLMDTIPGFAFIKDANLNYVAANKTFCDLVQVSQTEIKGKNDFDIFPHDLAEKYISDDKKVIESREPMFVEEETIDPEGKRFIVATRKLIWKYEGREEYGIYGLGFDITELKEKEKQLLIEKEKAEAHKIELEKVNTDLNRFLSILGHDLRSPFNSLLGFSDLLLQNVRNYNIEKIEKQLFIINQVAHHTYSLLEELLIWSKSLTGKIPFNPQKVLLSEICGEVIQDLNNNSQAKNINIHYFEVEPIELIVDLMMMKTTLRNLISNAIKFTERDGQINIYHEVKVNEAVITVSDNGVGIDDEGISSLWEISSHNSTEGTEGEKGTGLGLLICKEFIEKHKGRIWVESSVGQGSDFKISIPIEPHQ